MRRGHPGAGEDGRGRWVKGGRPFWSGNDEAGARLGLAPRAHEPPFAERRRVIRVSVQRGAT